VVGVGRGKRGVGRWRRGEDCGRRRREREEFCVQEFDSVGSRR